MSYSLIKTPDREQIEIFAREFLTLDPYSALYYSPLFDLMIENMTPKHEQKVLISKDKNNQTQGFVKYNVFNPKSKMDVPEISRIFSLGPITDSNGVNIQRSGIINHEPFSLYVGNGSFVFIDHIEVARSKRKKQVGKKLLEELIERENAELIEGLAHPDSVHFWNKMGFTFPDLYSRELRVVGWHKFLDPISKFSWGFYSESKIENRKAIVQFNGLPGTVGWGTPYAIYFFYFSEDDTTIFNARRAAIGVDDVQSNIAETKIRLNSNKLHELIYSMIAHVTTERTFYGQLLTFKE